MLNEDENKTILTLWIEGRSRNYPLELFLNSYLLFMAATKYITIDNYFMLPNSFDLGPELYCEQVLWDHP